MRSYPYKQSSTSTFKNRSTVVECVFHVRGVAHSKFRQGPTHFDWTKVHDFVTVGHWYSN